MRKLFLLCFAVMMIFFSGCSDMKDMESDLTIKVTGTDGLKFSGHYSFAGTGAVPKPENVSGMVPAEYKGKGVVAACLFRNTSGPGALKVEILRDGKMISESAVDTPYGVVTLKTPLPDKNTIVNQILKMVLGK